MTNIIISLGNGGHGGGGACCYFLLLSFLLLSIVIIIVVVSTIIIICYNKCNNWCGVGGSHGELQRHNTFHKC